MGSSPGSVRRPTPAPCRCEPVVACCSPAAASNAIPDCAPRTACRAALTRRWPRRKRTRASRLEAAVAVGAATDLTDQAWWCPTLVQPDGSAAFFLGLRGGIFVNAGGRRFADDSLPYDRMGRELAADPARRIPCYHVFDSGEGGRLPAVNCVLGARRIEYLSSGVWLRADSLGEFGHQLGLPGDSLAGVVARSNNVRRGRCGRGLPPGRGRVRAVLCRAGRAAQPRAGDAALLRGACGAGRSRHKGRAADRRAGPRAA